MHKIYNPYKPLSIISDEAGAYIRKYDKTKQLVLFLLVKNMRECTDNSISYYVQKQSF